MEVNGIDIYNRIIEILDSRKMNKNDFFKSVNVSKQTLYNWKRNTTPSLDCIGLIAETLHVSMEWLTFGIRSEDSSEATSTRNIVTRIYRQLENKTGFKQYENNPDFYSSIEKIVSPIELQDWDCGRSFPDLKKLTLIAKEIDVSVQYLITGNEISKEVYHNYCGPTDRDNETFYKNFYCLNEQYKERLYQYAIELRKAQNYEREHDNLNVNNVN